MFDRRSLFALALGLLVAVPARASVSVAVAVATPFMLFGLFLASLLFGVAELFLLPGFGVAGLLALACFGTHAFLLFTSHALIPALGILGVEMVIAVGATALAIRVLPHTAIGRSMIQVKAITGKVPSQPLYDPDLWIGRRGTAAGSIRPSGDVWIEDEKHSARSRSGLIDDGTPIEVVGIDGRVLVVRPVED